MVNYIGSIEGTTGRSHKSSLSLRKASRSIKVEG